jgi:hypothetical protein
MPATIASDQSPPVDPPPAVDPPKHPLPELATFELSRYRRDLEHALAAWPAHAPSRALLQDKLTEVLAEQESRKKTAGA